MKTLFKSIFLTVLLFISGTAFGRDKITIAVVEFEKTGGARIDTRMATEAFQTALVRRSEFTVVERSRIDSVLQEQALGMSGMISGNDAMQLGQFVGASMILTGQIGYAGDHYVINVRAIDSETGVLKFADMVMAWDEQSVVSVMTELAKRVAKLAGGGRVGEYRLPRRPEEPSAGRTEERRGIRLPQIRLRGIAFEFSPTFGSVLKFTNSNLYGFGVSMKIPGYGLLQLDAAIDYMFGNLTEYSKFSMFRLHPAFLVNIAENRLLVFGIKIGYAFEVCNMKPMSSGLFAAGIYPFNQNSLTASAELGIKFSERIHLRGEWEFGFPLKFTPREGIDPIDATTRANMGIDKLEADGGFMTSLWSIKLDIIY